MVEILREHTEKVILKTIESIHQDDFYNYAFFDEIREPGSMYEERNTILG